MKTRKRLWIIIGSVVAVLAILAVAGWNWHEKPSFCSTVCHTAMDPYVASWESGDGMAAAHAAADVACLECHEPTLSEQLSEVGKTVTGNYTVPLEQRNFGTAEFCLECHGTYEDLAAATEGYAPPDYNPHDSHYDELDCYTCHSMHGQSEMFCTSCHDGLKVPDGWTAAPM